MRRISGLIGSQVPAYVREEGPNLVAFLKAYYEWAEQSNNVIDFTDYRSVDTTVDEFVRYFQDELFPSLPRAALVDKRLFAHHARSMHRSRGSEKSFDLLFRILFNEDLVEYYYPGNDILRVSDGRWVVKRSIRTEIVAGDPFLLSGRVTGSVSGAKATVERVLRTEESGITVYEVFLREVSGTFVNEEEVSNSDGSIVVRITSSVGGPSAATVVTGGSLHEVGDELLLVASPGFGARARVTGIRNDSAVCWDLVSGGNGYAVNSIITIAHGPGTGTSWEITSLANTFLASINTDFILPMGPVPLDEGATFTTNGANTGAVSANLAASNSSTVLNAALAFFETTVGRINSIATLSRGRNYSSLPTTHVRNDSVADYNVPDEVNGGFLGNNAVILARRVPGTITSVAITNPGTGYSNGVQATAVNLSSANTEDGVLSLVITGIVPERGSYEDTKGWISWNNRLQDNHYYQEFSYAVKSVNSIVRYRDAVKRMLHPAGTALFGILNISGNASMSFEASANLVTWGTGTGNVVSNGTAVLSGLGTTFSSELSAGDTIRFAGGLYDVVSVANNTRMTVNESVVSNNQPFYINIS